MQFLYILLALFIFGILIFIHELGHFVAARLCGVQVLEFAIGMGPKLLSKKSKKSGTVYSLRAFPIGGFINMLGENGMEAVQGSAEGEENGSEEQNATESDQTPDEASNMETANESDVAIKQDDPRAYCNQSVWKRILISLAGPAMNVVLGFVLMLVFVLVSGHSALGTNEIAGFYVGFSGQEATKASSREIICIPLTRSMTVIASSPLRISRTRSRRTRIRSSTFTCSARTRKPRFPSPCFWKT